MQGARGTVSVLERGVLAEHGSETEDGGGDR